MPMKTFDYNLDCDFVVFLRLNIGGGSRFKNRGNIEIKNPQYWILPIENAKTGLTYDKFNTYKSSKIKNISAFENAWQLIFNLLQTQNNLM